jgi:hypothetical protein
MRVTECVCAGLSRIGNHTNAITPTMIFVARSLATTPPRRTRMPLTDEMIADGDDPMMKAVRASADYREGWGMAARGDPKPPMPRGTMTPREYARQSRVLVGYEEYHP